MTADRNKSYWKSWSSSLAGILLYATVLATSATAQCPVSNPDDDLPPPLPTVNSSTRTGEPRIPESGYLSNTSYASTYFGFVIDLPIEVDGHRIMMPLMPPGQHALLALGFQEGRRSGTLLITASEPKNAFQEINEDGKIVPTPGEGYQGPTIPSALVDAALADKPALDFIERGEFAKGVYRN